MNIQNVLRNMWLAFLYVFILGVFGCEGDDSSKSNSRSIDQNLALEPVTLSAQDASFSSELSDLFEVQLDKHVKVSDGSGYELAEVVPISQDSGCLVESMTESSFSISAKTPRVCNYRYRVVSANAMRSDNLISRATPASSQFSQGQPSSASAVARVAFSANPSSTVLMPISAVTLENQTIAVNLITELAKYGVDLNGYTLHSDITLPYNPNSVAVANSATNVIDYTPASGFQGVDRILFSYVSSTDDRVLMGVLDVAVAQVGNQGLTVSQHILYPTIVNQNEVFEIDISPYVTSHDDDDYQLVNVDAFNALVASKLPLDTTNKVFTFQSSSIGTHTVSFAVSDHNGAYEMGLIQITVRNLNSAGDWGALELDGKIFSAPLTVQDANNANVEYDTMLVDEGYSPRKFLAGFRQSSAEDYCALTDNNSRLPTKDELISLSSSFNIDDTNWPSMNQYLVLSDFINGSPLGFNIDTRTVYNFDENTAFYVTCIAESSPSDLRTETLQIDTFVGEMTDVTIELTRDGIPVSGATLVAYETSHAIDFVSGAAFTNSEGKATFSFTIPSEGTYSFKVRSSESNILTLTVNAISTSDVDYVLTPFSTKGRAQWGSNGPQEYWIRSELTAAGEEIYNYSGYTFRLEPENPNISISHEIKGSEWYVVLRYDRQAFNSEVDLGSHAFYRLIGEAAGLSTDAQIYWLRGSACTSFGSFPALLPSLTTGSCLNVIRSSYSPITPSLFPVNGKFFTGPVNPSFWNEYHDLIADSGFIDLDTYFNGDFYHRLSFSSYPSPSVYGLHNGNYRAFGDFNVFNLNPISLNLSTSIYVDYARGFCRFLNAISFMNRNNWYLPNRSDFPSVIDVNVVKSWGWPDHIYGVIEDQIIYTGSLTEPITFQPLNSPLPSVHLTLGFCMSNP